MMTMDTTKTRRTITIMIISSDIEGGSGDRHKPNRWSGSNSISKINEFICAMCNSEAVTENLILG